MQTDKIAAFVSDEYYKPMNSRKIAEALGIKEQEILQLEEVLNQLVDKGILVKGKKDRYFTAKSLGMVSGILRTNVKGFGFVIGEDGDIYIPCEDINGALNGDKVLIRRQKSGRNGRSFEGAVVRILRRAEQIVVGIYKQERAYGLIIPDNERLPREIFVPPSESGGALNGQKVVAEIIEYESPTTSLQCRVKEILGFPYDFGVDMVSIIKSYGFSVDFPPKVTEEVSRLSPVSEKELSGRLDLTGKTVITIDGDDTKDIDDAISIEEIQNGYRLGVHIADVSHYVRPGSAADREAYDRGTSVYLADRVIPMLPVKLSNDLCSLNEGVLRLTMSVIMDFDKDGNITSERFYKSFIKSRARMTYNNVRLILDEHPPELCERYTDIVPSLELMRTLAALLNKKTRSRGAIDFNIPEAKAVFDKNGKTIDIVLRENTFANNIIEEFMIAANSCVAKYLSEHGIAAVYRIHENPDEKKLEEALNFVYNLGYNRAASLSGLMESVKGTAHEAAVSTMLLRSMAKARYSSRNEGHYGLMLENYCHFTSPIRRYPDLVCHRALKAIIENDEKAASLLVSVAPSAAEQSSDREQAAQMCERDALDTKKAEYMHSHIGEEFAGIISSVNGFGFFVMLPNTVEGLVRVETLRDDYYVYDEKTFSLTGERSGRVFSIGDAVRVKLAAADKTSRRIDFILLEGGTIHGGKRKGKNTCTKQKRPSRVLHRRKARGRH